MMVEIVDKNVLKLCQYRIIWYLLPGFKTIIVCSVNSIRLVKCVSFAEIWFVKTSTRIVKYEPLVIKLNPDDLSQSIKNSKIHHFADYANLLYASSSFKDIDKKINFDLSNLVQWFQANKIALVNINKVNIVSFWSPRKQITKKMNFHLSGQKIRKKACTKYVGVLLDEYLLCKDHINFLKQKLNRVNGILAKLRHHSPSDILKTVHYSLFDTHLHYECQVWGKTS